MSDKMRWFSGSRVKSSIQRSTSCKISARRSSSLRSCCQVEFLHGFSPGRDQLQQAPAVSCRVHLYLGVLTQRIEPRRLSITILDRAKEMSMQRVVCTPRRRQHALPLIEIEGIKEQKGLPTSGAQAARGDGRVAIGREANGILELTQSFVLMEFLPTGPRILETAHDGDGG